MHRAFCYVLNVNHKGLDMGGYSEKCPFCEKWYLSRGALNDHMKGKHGVSYTKHFTLKTKQTNIRI